MKTYAAFAQDMWLANGSRDEVVVALRTIPPLDRASDLLVFDDEDAARSTSISARSLLPPRHPKRRAHAVARAWAWSRAR